MSSWRDRVLLFAEVGLRGAAAGEMVWDTTHWDAPLATWSGLEPTFTELPGSEVESLRVTRGRSAAFERPAAGTAELGLVWRNATGGRWSFRGSTPVQVGAELRIRAVVDGGSPIPLYRGTVRSVRDAWHPGRAEPGRSVFRMAVRLVDRLADLGSVDLPEAASAAGLDDLTHARVLRILALAGIDPYFAAMGTGFDDSGVVHLQSSTFARNLLDEAMVAAESEGSGPVLGVGRDGRFTFARSRWWAAIPGHTPNPRWNVTRATWANVHTDAPATFAATGFGTGQDLDDVRNHVSMARAGGSAITVENADSELRYGLRTFQQFDLMCRYDADVTAAADLRLEQLATRTNRVDAIASELDPRRSAADLEAFVDIGLGDQEAIRWDDGDGELAGTFHVLGYRLTIDPRHWSTELDLWAFEGEGLAPVIANTWGAGSAWGASLWQGPA